MLLLCIACASVSDDGGGWGSPERLDEADGVNAAFGVGLDTGGTTWVTWSALGDVVAARSGSPSSRDRIDQRAENEEASSPALAVNPDGHAVAVWIQFTRVVLRQPDDYAVWSSHYLPGDGWSDAERVDRDGLGAAFGHRIAIDGEGNAIAIWHQSDGSDGGTERIWANRSSPGTGWGIAERFETDDLGHARNPRVAFDALGNAVAVWQQFNGEHASIWAKRYVPGSEWSFARRVSDGLSEARLADVALDPRGNAIAVWQQDDDGRFDIWFNRFTPSGGWGEAPRKIELDDEGDATNARVGMDADGRAVAVWKQFDGIAFGIRSSQYVSGEGWSDPQRLDRYHGGDALRPRVAVSASGMAIAVWPQSDGFFYDAWSNAYSPGRGWGAPRRIDPANLGRGQPLRIEVAMDAEGNAAAAWLRRDPDGSSAPPKPSQLWTAASK